MQRYIILGNQRSGTTVVHLALKGHPQVSALNDEARIIPLFSKDISTFTYGNDTQNEKSKSLLGLFDCLTTFEKNQETLAHGLKIATSKPEEVKLMCEKLSFFPKLKVVLVCREDFVAQYGSHSLAQKTEKWHSWRKSNEPNDLKIEIDENDFTINLYNCLKTINIIRDFGKKVDFLEFSYNDIVDGNYKHLFEFIGVENLNPVWLKSNKVAKAPEEYIKNYSQMTALKNRYLSNFSELERDALALIKQKERISLKNKVIFKIIAFLRSL